MSQPATARFAFAALVLAALTAAAAIAGVRMGLIAYADGYRLMYPATGLGLVALVLAVRWTARALKRNESSGRRLGLAALAGSVALLYPPVTGTFLRLTTPPLYDVSTNTANPPRFAALLKLRGPDANPPDFDATRTIAYKGEQHPVSYVLHDYYFDLMKPRAGFTPGRDPFKVFYARDLEAVKKTGWTIVEANEAQGRIEATHASFWFGRISDIVVQVRVAGRGARTDIRSQSRHDTIDEGFNGANIKRFQAILPTVTLAQ